MRRAQKLYVQVGGWRELRSATNLRFVAAELGTGTYVDLMAQYHPAGLVGASKRDSYQEINRRLAREEYDRAAAFAGELGLTRLDQRSRASGLRLSVALVPAGT